MRAQPSPLKGVPEQLWGYAQNDGGGEWGLFRIFEKHHIERLFGNFIPRGVDVEFSGFS